MIISNKAKANFLVLGLAATVVSTSMILTSAAQASMAKSNAISKASPTAASQQIPSQNQPLRIGSRGTAVDKLQTALKKDGFYSGAIDGIFGRQTQAAVVKFQQSRKLAVDGVVGTQTRSALSI
ncbi:peptidoglycan-binding domain-containing protein [Leptolyngbya sp. NIES-2104]|uniref:peptidoglycan-binding domain-containing protein n=1 Tax=Leptolyngbya sp. NIES-2104 TaxID=1552121 RepID=UPI0006ECCE7B|nr:peptidoglycan-binding domain-containing protein [Leptolyngbya sp. NIES-2104]GAP99531.1 N-acetylmuramoyl-L-alanine amidase [Leptolyngbya sp. NIES-2104]